MKKLTLKRMMILPLILLIPVNILVVAVSILNLRADSATIRTSVENHVSRSVEQFAETVKKIEDQVYLNIEINKNYITLGVNERGYEDKEYYYAATEMLNTLNNIVSIEPLLQSTFLRFDNNGELFQRGQLSDELRAALEAPGMQGEFPQVVIMPEDYIGYIKKTRYGLIGYQIDIKPLLNNIRGDVISLQNIIILKNGNEAVNDEDAFIVLEEAVPELGVTVYSYYHSNGFLAQVSVTAIVVFILSLISIIATPILVSYYYRQIYIPVKALNQGMNIVKQGNLDYRIHLENYTGDNEFVDTIQYFNEMVDQVNNMKINVYELQLAQKELRLEYYSQQIRPHFILNVLNTIYTYRPEQWDLAQQLILNLVEYFRYVVNIKKDFVPLASELVFVKNYLEIQKQRLEGAFTCMVSWEHSLDGELIPPLIISSFVENCIKHGLTGSKVNCIVITVMEDKGRMKIKICDSGEGFSEDALKAFREYRESKVTGASLGRGIVNSMDRLDLYYGNDYSLEFRNDGGAVVELILPKKDEKG